MTQFSNAGSPAPDHGLFMTFFRGIVYIGVGAVWCWWCCWCWCCWWWCQWCWWCRYCWGIAAHSRQQTNITAGWCHVKYSWTDYSSSLPLVRAIMKARGRIASGPYWPRSRRQSPAIARWHWLSVLSRLCHRAFPKSGSIEFRMKVDSYRKRWPPTAWWVILIDVLLRNYIWAEILPGSRCPEFGTYTVWS